MMTLTEIKGIGAAAAEQLSRAGLPTVEEVAAAPIEVLCAIHGFGLARAKAVNASAMSLLSPTPAEEHSTKKDALQVQPESIAEPLESKETTKEITPKAEEKKKENGKKSRKKKKKKKARKNKSKSKKKNDKKKTSKTAKGHKRKGKSKSKKKNDKKKKGIGKTKKPALGKKSKSAQRKRAKSSKKNKN